MVTLQLPRRVRRRSITDALRRAGLVLDAVKRGSRPVSSHLAENFYTMAGLSFFSAAGYVHSLFTGLIVTGVSFLVLEWRVRE